MCEPSHVMNSQLRHGERIVEKSGQRWTIREMSAGNIPGAHRSHCLICESDDVVRRIWDYPHDWRSLDDSRLIELCYRSVA